MPALVIVKPNQISVPHVCDFPLWHTDFERKRIIVKILKIVQMDR